MISTGIDAIVVARPEIIEARKWQKIPATVNFSVVECEKKKTAW